MSRVTKGLKMIPISSEELGRLLCENQLRLLAAPMRAVDAAGFYIDRGKVDGPQLVSICQVRSDPYNEKAWNGALEMQRAAARESIEKNQSIVMIIPSGVTDELPIHCITMRLHSQAGPFAILTFVIKGIEYETALELSNGLREGIPGRVPGQQR